MRSEALKPSVPFPSSAVGGPNERVVGSYPEARGPYGDISGVGFPGMPPPNMGPSGPGSMGPGGPMGPSYGYGYGDFSAYGSMGMNP